MCARQGLHPECCGCWPPDPGHTCHDVLHHRHKVGRLAEGGVVVLILERNGQASGTRKPGLVTAGRLDTAAPRNSADLSVTEPGGVSRGNQVTLQLGPVHSGRTGLGETCREFERMDGEGQSDENEWRQLGLPVTPSSPGSPVGLPAELQVHSSSLNLSLSSAPHLDLPIQLHQDASRRFQEPSYQCSPSRNEGRKEYLNPEDIGSMQWQAGGSQSWNSRPFCTRV